MATGVTTEWDDLQVKMGNWLPREKGPTNEEVFTETLQKAEEVDEYMGKSLKQMEEMK